MILQVTAVDLPVDEKLMIRKQRIAPPGGSPVDLPRISIVTGVHGDELEGQYVCYELERRIMSQPGLLKGIVDIYPAMNPLGIDTIQRGLPGFDLDMNRIFPGGSTGDMNEYVAHKIIKDLEGSKMVVDIHASNIYLTEIPQIRINEITTRELLPLSASMNVDLIWVHSNSTVLESTLAYTLNSRNTPTLVVEMGVGMRITRTYGDQLVLGILETMRRLGVWDGEPMQVRKPVVSNAPDSVIFFNAPTSGIYLKEKEVGATVKKGDLIGRLINPLSGEVLSMVTAPENGLLFTTREYPVVMQGSLLARILKQNLT